jgi:hypothetical protein
MVRGIIPASLAALLLCVAAWPKEKKLPSGEAGNDSVQITATWLDSEQLKDTFGTDFDNMFQVIEVTMTPRNQRTVDVHLDDFLIRSEQTGDHSGPLAASQIAGQDTLVLHQGDAEKKKKGGFGGGIGLGPIMMGGGGGGAPPPEMKTEIKKSDKRDPLLDVLKRKILAEKPIQEPVTGLLFFSIEKDKPKNLVLIYSPPVDKDSPDKTAPEKLRMKFK